MLCNSFHIDLLYAIVDGYIWYLMTVNNTPCTWVGAGGRAMDKAALAHAGALAVRHGLFLFSMSMMF